MVLKIRKSKFLSGCCNINQRFVSASFSTEAQTVIINLVILFYVSFEKKNATKHWIWLAATSWKMDGFLSLITKDLNVRVTTDFSKTESIPWYYPSPTMQALLSLLWLSSVDIYQDISPATTLNTWLGADLTPRRRLTCAKRDLPPTCFYFNYLLFTDCVNNIEKLTFVFKSKERLQS